MTDRFTIRGRLESEELEELEREPRLEQISPEASPCSTFDQLSRWLPRRGFFSHQLHRVAEALHGSTAWQVSQRPASTKERTNQVEESETGRARWNALVSIPVVLCLLLTAVQVDAGPLRHRERFNEKANGFWMKGRCFFPGRVRVDPEWNLVFPGSGAAATFGCLVKNRKGKRRAGKRKANVKITVEAVYETGTGSLRTHRIAEDSCMRSRRCRVRTDRILTHGPDPAVLRSDGSDIVGLIATICGQRVGWRTKKFKKPTSGPEDRRLDWCLNWGTECGPEAADAYCRAQGYDRAFNQKKDPAVKAVTYVPGTGEECNGLRRHCDSFKFIRCGRRRDATRFSVHVGRTPEGRRDGKDKRRDLPTCDWDP